MAYNHGIRIKENPTSIAAPVSSTAGLQVVVGVAPVNLAKDPYSCTNVPLLADTFEKAAELVGYQEDFATFNICEVLSATFVKAGVGPVVIINVLDPTTDTKNLTSASYTVEDSQVTIEQTGILADQLVVTHNSATLVKDTDYIVEFDKNGYAVLTFLAVLVPAEGQTSATVTISGKQIDPSLITASDIIGSVDASTGAETGLEVIRQIFPKLNVVPGLIISPGWSKNPNIAAAIAAKCESINGVFSCECIVDLDSSTGHAVKYTDVEAVKTAAALVSPRMDVVWPCAKMDGKVYHGSAIKAAYTALSDANNDDVPNVSPSNIRIPIDGICLEDGTEVILDEQRANVVNSYGVSTFNNFQGWVLWGNRTAAYPQASDPKDVWFCCRRFFSWWANSFVLTYHERVDSPANYRLIESVVDDENVKGNSLAAQGKCAGAYMEFREDENTPEQLMLNGGLVFRQHLAPYPPAEDMLNILEFDPALLAEAFTGGE